VDVKVKNVPIDQALDACLKDLPLEYKIVDKTVVNFTKRAHCSRQDKICSQHYGSASNGKDNR